MMVLKIIGIILAIIFVIAAAIGCNEFTMKKFGHAFFTKSSVIVIAIAAVLFLGGYKWYEKLAVAQDGDILNPIVLMSISVLIYIGVIIYNIKKTNFVIGFPLTLLQITLFSVIGVLGVGLFIFVVVFGLLCSILGGQTYETKDGKKITIR